jgi:hypothetical protein
MSSLPAAVPPGAPRRGFAVASLVIGILSLPTLGLVGIGAILSVVLGVIALVKANRAPVEFGGTGFAIGGIVCGVLSLVLIPFLGILAAIAIPALLRARISANEAAALADVRAVVAAEAAYESTYGAYDRPACLADPASCAPGRSGATPLLDRDLATVEIKAGYRRSFRPGPRAAQAGAGSRSPSAVMAFAYVAEPVTPNRTGMRSFCGDSSGTICAVLGEMPPISDDRCPESCQPLR